jgi:NADP-dependent 3-hydroxy acid dehydrogenase YdfG
MVFFCLGIKVRKLDVTDKESIFALAEELGRVDILFNCAGSVHLSILFRTMLV